MKIVVCVKEVPDTTEIKIDPEHNTLIREGVPSIINPFDLNALEEALKIKDENQAEVIVISMGPPSVEKNLKELLAMGADKAYLITDRAFAGADTLATSLTLTAAIKKIGDVDLIVTGKQAIDGDTAQVGPGIAELLDVPQLIFIQRILKTDEKTLTARRATESGYEDVEVELPAVISIIKSTTDPRLPSLRGMMKAKRAEVPQFEHKELGLDPKDIGLNGSPTKVIKIFTPQREHQGRMLEGEADEVSKELVKELRSSGLIS